MDEDVDPAAVVGDDRPRGERGRSRGGGRRRGRGGCRPPACLFSPPVAADAVASVAAADASTPTTSCSTSRAINSGLLSWRRRQRVARRQLPAADALVPDTHEAEAEEGEPRAAAPEEGDDARTALLVAEEERGEAVCCAVCWCGWFLVVRLSKRERGLSGQREKRGGNRGAKSRIGELTNSLSLKLFARHVSSAFPSSRSMRQALYSVDSAQG